MGSKKKTNPPPTPDVLWGDMNRFMEAINHANDLACVLVTTSYLEQAMASLLRSFFVDDCTTADGIFDYETGGILCDLSAKAKIARCVGVVNGTTFSNLNLISGIRNRFAHTHPELTFSDSKIAEFCRQLRFDAPASAQKIDFVAKQESPGVISVTHAMTRDELDEQYSEPKRRFTTIAVVMGSQIVMAANKVNRCQPHASERKKVPSHTELPS